MGLYGGPASGPREGSDMAENEKPAADEIVISEEALKKAEEFIEEEEGATSKFTGRLAAGLTAIAVIMSLFHLYAAYSIVSAQVLRPVHVGFTLLLSFLLFPILPRFRHRIMWWDVAGALLGVAIIGYMLYWGDDFGDRATSPMVWDQILGAVLIVLILEAARRTSGWIMPFVVVMFIVYAMVGPHLPAPWTHRGYDISRLTGHMYMTLEGIFGVAVDVSSSLIILFTIYGAFLQFSGAGKFFIDFSFAAMGGKHSSAGRTVVLGLVPARRTVRFRGCNDGDTGVGRLSDARQGRVREGPGGGAACRRRNRRNPLAAGSRRRGFPDRRIPQDLLP